MTLKLTIKIKGIDDVLEQLRNLQKSELPGKFVYPVFKNSIVTDITMLELTRILIGFSLGDYVAIALGRLEALSDEAFQAKIFEVLEEWGQKPPLTRSPLLKRKKLGVGDTPRNVITGEYVRCFGLGFSDIIPADIPREWIRQL